MVVVDVILICTQDSTTSTVTRSMRIPSITYSLNIANAFNDSNEVIAKPASAST